MNTRCHYCGWNFTLSREAIETAVATAMATNEKTHIEHCPRCRRVIKMPVDQLRRSLPPGWTPAEPAAQPDADGANTTEAPAGEPGPEPALEAAAEVPAPADEEAETARRAAGKTTAKKAAAKGSGAKKTAAKKSAAKSARKTAAKSPSGKSAAKSPAAKKTARKQPKP